MTWMDACWTVMAAACLTLASIHLLVWSKQRQDLAHLSFAVASYAITAIGVIELLMMRADSAAQFALLSRWMQVPLAVLVVALVAYVRLHLDAGRPWLARLTWMLRVLVLVPNFSTGVSVNFLEISAVRAMPTWGGVTYMTPVGITSPAMLLVTLANFVLIAFFVDAAWSGWRRRRDPAQAKVLRICGSIAGFVVFAVFWHMALVIWHVPLPVTVLPAFTGVVLVMSYELGGDVVRAARLALALETSEVTLKHSEERIEDAVVAAGLGLWERDIASGGYWLSTRAREMLGIDGDGTIDPLQIRSRVDPGHLAALDLAMAQMLAKGGEYLAEFRVAGADGTPRWLLARGRGEFDAGGEAVAFRGVLVDITERKQAAVQRDELTHLSRVALLAELSGSLAHELNQPLTSILSNAQAAQRFMAHAPPNLAEVGQSLANIVESDKRAGEVIRRMRALLRKEAADFRRIDLNEIVQEVLRIIRSDLLNKGVAVRLELQPDLPASEGDRVQLQQVLLNLIVNGSDAMHGVVHGRELTIRTVVSAGGGVQLTVADRGSGIPDADLEKIFSPFVTSKHDGMGLGLAVCTTIVEAHRGRLWASNNDGGGASLHFRLPVCASSVATATGEN